MSGAEPDRLRHHVDELARARIRAALSGRAGTVGQQPPEPGLDPLEIAERRERRPDVVQQPPDDQGGRLGPLRDGVDEHAVDPVVAGPPGRESQQRRGHGQGRFPLRCRPCGRLHQRPAHAGHDHRVVEVTADVGHADLHRGVPRGDPGVEVDHPVVEEDAGVDHRPHQRLVCLGRPEEVGGPRRRPAHPELRAVRRVPGVAPVRERRVGRQRQHDGEPAADPVDDRHALLRRGDAYVDVAPAGQHLLGRRPEPLGHPQVPRLGRDEAVPGQRRSPEGRRPRSGLARRERDRAAASHEARARRRRGRCTRRTGSRPCSAAARPRSHPRGRRRPAVARPRRR